ncbi:MAG: DUF1566 domain-containing protein [Ferruginibacter sp.]
MKKIVLLALVPVLLINTITNAQVGIGTTTPNAKAALDITSTTKGFLLPRMTATQKDSITSPPAGLMIYCTTCVGGLGEPQYYNGTKWLSMTGCSGVFQIGDSYQGGKIVYIFQPGDSGYISGQVHGIIAAASDQGTGIQWYNGSFITTGAGTWILGFGNANTNKIVIAQGAGSYAAKLCYDLVLNGYSDWYLPSKDELNKLYINRIAIGGFSGAYWSSTENGNTQAWYQVFTNGAQAILSKDNVFGVRPVQSF